MKLKLRPTSKAQALKKNLTLKLTKKSEAVRQEELHEQRKVLVTAKPREGNVKIKLTRKRGAGNLTLNSAHPAPADTGLPATAQADSPVWQARKMHGRHLPVLVCSNCSISRVCPKFRAGYECAYLPYLNSHKVESVDDLVKYMKIMVGNSMKRAQMMSIIEAASGGMPSVETSESLDTAFRQLKDLHSVMKDSGSDEDIIEIEGDNSIIGNLFGGLKLQKLVEQTDDMHKNDPMISLPAPAPDVPRAATDPIAQVSAASLNTQELIKDAISAPSALGKKDLPDGKMPSISVGSL